MPERPRALRLLPVLLLFAADAGSKALARRFLAWGEPVSVFPFADFRLHYNDGIAFGLLAGGGLAAQVVLSLIGAVFILVFARLLLREAAVFSFSGLAFLLITAGALGNVVERVLFARITDFISVHWAHRYFFPTFNLADAFIFLGVVSWFLFLAGSRARGHGSAV